MAKLKRLPKREENLVEISFPLSTSEIEERNKEYHLLTPKQFGTKFKELLYTPIKFTLNGSTHQIQYNHCANPYCANHGRAQTKFATKGKATRYRLTGVSNQKSINCNPDPTSENIGEVLGCNSSTVSNWSVAQEIQRLIRINSVEIVEPEYTFHIDGCVTGHLAPFEEPNAFYKRGRSSGKSQKWQCKLCKKITNVLPDGRQSITYNQ